MKILAITSICITALLCGCALKYEDVSNQAGYSDLIKKQYSLRSDMFILGINLPPGYGDDINIYAIRPIEYGRIKGLEILSEEILQSGTILEVQNIKKSINNLPGYQIIDAVVTVTPNENKVDVPITIPLKHLQSTDWMEEL
jgi:hypothetical protein